MPDAVVRRKFVKISLRSLLLLCVAAALLLRYTVIPIQQQKEGRQWVESQRGHYSYDRAYRADEKWPLRKWGVPVPKFAIDCLGIDAFATVKYVHLDCDEIYDLEPISGLSGIEELYINQFVHDDVDFSKLRSLRNLKKLELTRFSGMDVRRLEKISAQLPNVAIVAEGIPQIPAQAAETGP